MNSRTITKEFTVTLKSGRTVTAEVESVWVREVGYGADADGRRGIDATFMDECYLTHSVEVDDDDRYLLLDEQEEAEDLIMTMAENDDWEEIEDECEF